jgi:hypothetical protein
MSSTPSVPPISNISKINKIAKVPIKTPFKSGPSTLIYKKIKPLSQIASGTPFASFFTPLSTLTLKINSKNASPKTTSVSSYPSATKNKITSFSKSISTPWPSPSFTPFSTPFPSPEANSTTNSRKNC